MYRNDDKRELADKWEGWANFFQFGTLGMLFAMILILESISKEQARVVVWYLGGFLFVTATIGFFLARKALKLKMIYLNSEKDRVSGLFDNAIEAAKKEEKAKAKS